MHGCHLAFSFTTTTSSNPVNFFILQTCASPFPLFQNPVTDTQQHIHLVSHLHPLSRSTLLTFLYSLSDYMSVYNHRPMMPAVQGRIIEMLDAIRVEFDQLAQEAYVCKSQRDDFELKSN